MKTVSHRGAALLLAVTLAFSPLALAGTRSERRRDLPDPIIRIVKKIQKIFGITTNDDGMIPPRP
jgi:hypothetical protein